MPKFVGCLIHFWCWLVASFTGSKCGKGKLIEAFFVAISSSLLVSQVQKLLSRCKFAFRGRWNFSCNIVTFVVLESQKVRVHFVGYRVSGNLLLKPLKHWWETSPNKQFKLIRNARRFRFQ